MRRRVKETRQLLLVLSHMRSYSTLLTHILADNPSIHGWQEQHRSYLTMSDVDATVASILRDRSESIACDNLLHNGCRLGEAPLASERIEWMVSIRQAPATLASLVRWGGHQKKFRESGVAADYLTTRLEELGRLGQVLDGRFVLLRSNRLVNQPESTLQALTEALDLETPLREHYAVDEDSGAPGLGDFSRYITSGRIVAERKHGPPPDLHQDDLERVVEVRETVLRSLRQHARVVV